MSAKILRGHYKILKPLGSGGFGKTFLAADTDLPGNPTCVVKMLKPMTGEPVVIKTAQRLFNKEAEILYKLGNHDQIPRLMAHFEQSNRFFLVQEYVEGKGLNRLLTPGRQFPQKVVLDLLQDLLQVLDFVHGQQVIHRDIKPANLIMRDSDRKIVLIDFGAVKEMSGLTMMDSGKTNITITIGTPGYMPSEQLAGKPRYCSDLYALGMVALQALTGCDPGELPEDAKTAEIKWRDRLGENYCHPMLAAILDKMVRYDFRNRYQSAAEILVSLDEIQNNVLASKSFGAEANIAEDLAEGETIVTGNQGLVGNTGSSPAGQDHEATVVHNSTAKQYSRTTQANPSVPTQTNHPSQSSPRRVATTIYTNRKSVSRAKSKPKKSANLLGWGMGAFALVGLGGLGTFWLMRSPEPILQSSVQPNPPSTATTETTPTAPAQTAPVSTTTPPPAANNPSKPEPATTPQPTTQPQQPIQVTVQETNNPPAAPVQSAPAPIQTTAPVTAPPQPTQPQQVAATTPQQPQPSQQSANPLLTVNINVLGPPQIESMVASFGPQKAVEFIEQAIDQNPNSWKLYMAKGKFLSQLGRHAEAKAAQDKAISLGAPPVPTRPGSR
ncbi:serine/threonine protein kinase [Thalassoporum mexicanum PCC 7367]|uniref:serine/threonine-protein kinase n=1 Tax=Thalassoporum mexicanum TaxID=3457544 RepID=UPI00029FC053|nr:serine/threonine-protein kinase [Pseudanabaena sp. PCC 7367]AFY69163.1 serine/threonine protein kinase [Pseudanabaena sp. PCC 7367]